MSNEGTQKIHPVASGFESPLVEDREQRESNQEETSRGADEALSDAAKRRWSAWRIAHQKSRSHDTIVGRGDATIVEDEEGVAWHEWTDENGDVRRRRVRADAGTPRGPYKRRVSSTSLGEELRAIEEGERDVEKYEEAVERRAYWDEIADRYREFHGLPVDAHVHRPQLHRWAKLLRCGGIPPDGECPACGERRDPRNRRLWSVREIERRVVCRRCNNALGEEKQRARRPRPPRSIVQDATLSDDVVEKISRFVEIASTMLKIRKRDDDG